MPPPRLLRAVPTLALVLLAAAPARGEPQTVVELHGILRGTVLPVDGYWKWKPTENRHGILGTFEAVSREFEQKEVVIGADRSVFTAAQRAAFEADHAKRVPEYGEPHELDLKPTVSVARFKMKGSVYACAAKQMGRTALFARASAEAKDEAALVRLVTSAVAMAKSTADEIDGWIPPEVKTEWKREASADLIVADDGTVDAETRAEVLKVVRDVHGLVKRAVGGSLATPFPPVVRLSAKRDLILHLANRRELPDAAYVAPVGELLVGPRKGMPEAEALVRGAVEQMLHHALGASNAEPVRTGLVRYALAVSQGAQPGALLPAHEEATLERAKSKAARSWHGLLSMRSVANYLSTDAEARSIDAELSVVWLLHGGTQGKGSFPKWVAGFRKFGHPDAAAEAALSGMDGEAVTAEFWKYWDARLTPKKPGKPGSKPPK